MATIETQLHGYRLGHQLLASSASLPKADQSLVDRLSDVAGPLRPGENFEPYLSAYPLPSGGHYVLARTWQDLTVSRAGCVRTLSLLIPSKEWESAPGVTSFLDLLDPGTFPSDAKTLTLTDAPPLPLPPAPTFRASELIEALFLEEVKPVVVFDAPAPELIALRLLTAFWPALRRRFALSTFALSPRNIEGRSFDLVFAPKGTRAKFTNWPGRRIDAQSGPNARHRWTAAIVDRVFSNPIPRLLDARDIRRIGNEASGTASALRIALLWDELMAKLELAPSAALGLLDIINSRAQVDPEEILALQPRIERAALRAAEVLPASDAWALIGAMARKMYGTSLAGALPSVEKAAGLLVGKAFTGALALLDQPDPRAALEILVPAIAQGLSEHFSELVEMALAHASPATLTRLIEASEELAATTMASPILVARLAQIVPDLTPSQFEAVRKAVVPFLLNDVQVVLARLFFAILDTESLIQEVRHLGEVNEFAATAFFGPLVDRAREIEAIGQLREILLVSSPSVKRNQFIQATLSPSVNDVGWLVSESGLDSSLIGCFLIDLVRNSSHSQFRTLLTHASLTQVMLNRFTIEAPDILLRAVTEVQLPLALHVSTLLQLLPTCSGRQKVDLARRTLARCLREHFGGDEANTISILLSVVGSALDSSWATSYGLENCLPTSIISRNLIAFHTSSEETRSRILDAIEEIGAALAGRYIVDLDVRAANACAEIFWDAQFVDVDSLLRASGRLLPVLLRSRDAPVSAIVSATFPFYYRELSKGNDISELLKFVPFLDWDRCKIARQKLVEAFLSSTVWNPSDLALTACRALDVERILGHTAKVRGGAAYIERIVSDLPQLPPACRQTTRRSIKTLDSRRLAKRDFRD